MEATLGKGKVTRDDAGAECETCHSPRVKKSGEDQGHTELRSIRHIEKKTTLRNFIRINSPRGGNLPKSELDFI